MVRMVMFQIKDVKKEYQEGQNKFLALDISDLVVKKGEFISIIGRSGSGKSTLLRIIGSLLKPSSGEVMFMGENICGKNDDELAFFRHTHIGFVFQDFLLEEVYTVYQNIEIALMIDGYSLKERRKRIEEVLKIVNIENKKNVRVCKLSGGEKQRVAIARAIVNKPSCILADEPCGNLDTHNGQNVMKLLRKIAEDGNTVILVTHNLEDAKMADRIIELRDGKKVRDEKK
jgi:ABC-type lipoprotein export system ATPase subunit